MKTQFSAFVTKEFTHILRDKRTMLILFLTPIILILLFSYAISTEIRNVNVAILMPDFDPMVQKLGNKIDASSYFNVVDYLSSPSEIAPLMRSGKVDAVLSFNGDFSGKLLSPEGNLIDIVVDASNPNNATSEVMYLSAMVRDWMMSMGTSQEVGRFTGNVRMLYNPQLNSSYNFVPGILGLILMLICALMTSVSIVREKESGTMEVLLVSPVKPLTIIIAKMIPYLTMGVIDLAIILLMSKFVLGLPMAGSLFWIIASSLIYIILGLSIGLLVSTIAKTQVVASLVTAIMFLFPMLMLSGIMFPIESMPAFFQYASMIIPARWYIIILRRLMIQGSEAVFILKELGILVVMTIAVLTVALVKFNDKLE